MNRPNSTSAMRDRLMTLSYGLIFSLALAIAATVVGSIGLNGLLNANHLEIVTGLFQNLPTALSPSQTDTTLVVIGCTNASISGTNDVIKDGKVMLANTCPVIEDNLCQEQICRSDGICAQRTVVGGECSGDAQCLDLFGPGYVCNLTLCSCEIMVPVNGSMYTNSLICSNNGTMGVVMVMDAECPTVDQVLTATDSSHATWQDPNRELPCDTGDVLISNATCPVVGQVLTAISTGIAHWETPNQEIPCDGGNVVVSTATCPSAGQILTATGPSGAQWQTASFSITTDTITGAGIGNLVVASVNTSVTYIQLNLHCDVSLGLSLFEGQQKTFVVISKIMGSARFMDVDANINFISPSTGILLQSVYTSLHLVGMPGGKWVIVSHQGGTFI